MNKKMIFTASNEAKGEMVVRGFSTDALEAYNSEDIKVYEYRAADGSRLYAYNGAYGEAVGLSFEELEEFFKDIFESYEDEEEEDGEEIRRVTVPSWDGIKAGETVETGYSGQALTAPTEPGTYRLYQEVYADTNTHAGWVFEKIGEMMSFEDFQKDALGGNGVQNDSNTVWVEVGEFQYCIGIDEVLDHEEAEPFEASSFLEDNLDADAWEDLYQKYLDEDGIEL